MLRIQWEWSDVKAAYVIFDVPPGGDADKMKLYREKAFDTLIPYGGKAIVRTDDVDIRGSQTRQGLDTDAPPHHRISYVDCSTRVVRLARVSSAFGAKVGRKRAGQHGDRRRN